MARLPAITRPSKFISKMAWLVVPLQSLTQTTPSKCTTTSTSKWILNLLGVLHFYYDWNRFLSNAGIDAVKTDAQFFLDLLDDPKDRKRFMTVYQDAWTVSSLRYFSAKAISCMVTVPVFYNPLLTVS